MRAMIVMVALVLTGCAHASGVRYTFAPCNPGFQNAVMACFYEAGIGGLVVGYDFYADSGIIEQHWKRQYESCMFRRGYQQIDGTTTWHPNRFARFGWRSIQSRKRAVQSSTSVGRTSGGSNSIQRPLRAMLVMSKACPRSPTSRRCDTRYT